MAVENNIYNPNGMVDVNIKYKKIIENLPYKDKDTFECFTKWVIGMINDYHNPACHNNLFHTYNKETGEFKPRQFTANDIDWWIQWRIPGQTMMKWVRLGLVNLAYKSKKGNSYVLADDFLVSDNPNVKFSHSYSNNF